MTTKTWVPSTPGTFGERIKQARLLAGLTQEEMASKVGVNWKTLSTWERGTNPRTPGTGELARRFEDAIGIDRNWLLWGDELPLMHANVASDQAVSQLRCTPIPAGHSPARKERRRRDRTFIDLTERQRPAELVLATAA